MRFDIEENFAKTQLKAATGEQRSLTIRAIGPILGGMNPSLSDHKPILFPDNDQDMLLRLHAWLTKQRHFRAEGAPTPDALEKLDDRVHELFHAI